MGGQARAVTALLLFLAFVPVAFAADPACYKVNWCDANFASRVTAAGAQLTSAYNSIQTLNDPTKDNTEAFSAAFYYYSRSDMQGAGKSLLTNVIFKKPTGYALRDREALYLAWLNAKYAPLINADATLKNGIKARLDPYVASTAPTAEDAYLLRKTVEHLYGWQNAADLKTILKGYGNNGWPEYIEQNPQRLSGVVLSLLALYDQTSDPELRKLAEMNLDLIFARFSASSVNGRWVSPVTGATLASGAYDPSVSLWSGWWSLYLDAASGSTITGARTFEPASLVATYCPPENIQKYTSSPRTILEKSATGAPSADLLTSVFKDDSDLVALSGAQDFSGSLFDSWGFSLVGRASVGTGDSIEFEARTSAETGANPADGSETWTALLGDGRVLLGRIDAANACQEPHAVLSAGFKDRFRVFSDGSGGLLDAGGHYFLIRFLGPARLLPYAERYAPRANRMPTQVADYTVLYPDAAAFPYPASAQWLGGFALESVSPTFLDKLTATNPDGTNKYCPDVQGEDVDQCLFFVADKTKLVLESGQLKYLGLNSVNPATTATYRFNPPGTATTPSPALSNYGLRRVNKVMTTATTTDYVSLNQGKWTLYGAAGSGQSTSWVTITLDFNAADAASMKSSDDGIIYRCAATPPPPGSGATVPALGYAAATFLKSFEGKAYAIDCGPAANVLSGSELGSGLVKDACLITDPDGKRTIVLTYNPAAGNLQGVFDLLPKYFPYMGTTIAPPQRVKCDQSAQDTSASEDFKTCGSFATVSESTGLTSYSPLYAWVNGKNGVLVISQKDNPFVAGFWSAGIFTWLRNLFSGTEHGATEDVKDFTTAYFYSQGGAATDRKITAIGFTSARADIVYENFKQGLRPLADSHAGVLCGGTSDHKKQEVSFTFDAATWDAFTRHLRVDTSVTTQGAAATFCGSVCGDGHVDYGEQCDPFDPATGTTTAPKEYTTCPLGGLASAKLKCKADCTIDDSACATGCDLDGDGEAATDCSGGTDCYDADPATAKDASGGSCAGVTPATDPASPTDPCNSLPKSKCPQCVNLHRPRNLCGDAIANNCRGSGDPSDCVSGGGGSSTTYTCEGGTSSATCTDICTPVIPSCPTVKKLFVKQGHYTISTKIDNKGFPHLLIDPDNTKPTGSSIYCSWDGALMTPTVRGLDVTLASDGTSTIFTYTNPTTHETANIVLNQVSGTIWTLDYTGTADPSVNLCWGLSGTQNAFQTIRPLLIPDIQCTFDECDPATGTSPCTGTYSATSPNPEACCVAPKTCENIGANVQHCVTPPLGCGYLDSCQSDDDCLGDETCRQIPAATGPKCCRIARTCFVPGTPVLLADGSSKSIERIGVGDVVLGYDEERGVSAPTSVTQTLRHEVSQPLIVVNGRIEVTPEHLFSTQRGWVGAGALVLGDELLAPAGTEIVTSLGKVSYTGAVYNIHNTPYHDYYAGGVLVHNAKVPIDIQMP